MATLILKREREGRVLAGHPWIYRNEIADLQGQWRPGEAVTVLDGGGNLVGRGFYNPRTGIACRLLTRQDEPIDAAFFLKRIGVACAYRRSLGRDGNAERLVWSEADGLPGLVIDRYGPLAVIQCLTLGMSHSRQLVVDALQAILRPHAIYLRDEPGAARLEGFDPQREWASGEATPEVEIQEGPCRFIVNVESGQKTGFYLDQRENRELIGRLAVGRKCLDAFCYTSALSCHALAGGAERVVGIESQAEALALGRRHAEMNGFPDRAEFSEANAFDELRRLERQGERFGLIVLDPPPFTRRKEALGSAIRGYKEINLRALRLLEPGGFLATFSCSHHVTPPLFEEICQAAAMDSGLTVRLIAVLGQARDHPILLTVPESRYLKGLLLQAA